jgi:hypothetical protein
MSISYQSPKSDARRQQTLEQIIAVDTKNKQDGHQFVRDEVITAATAVYNQFAPAMDALSEKLSARMQLVAEKDTAVQLMEWHVRDAWAGLKRRVRRQGVKTAVLVYYGLPENGELPNSARQQDWLGYAQEVIAGDDEAAAAGFERLREPNQAEIQAAYTAANTLYLAVPSADLAYDMAQKEVADLRPEVDEVLADVVRDMRYNLSIAKMDKESERRIMRGYGFEFVTRTSTPEEAVDEMLAGEPEIDN